MKLKPIPPALPADVNDSLIFRECDTFARKIFVAYTTRIPWVLEHPNWLIEPKRKKPGTRPGST